jgi:hypothetical protein
MKLDHFLILGFKAIKENKIKDKLLEGINMILSFHCHYRRDKEPLFLSFPRIAIL